MYQGYLIFGIESWFHGGYNSTLYVHNIIPQYLKYHAFTHAPVCNKKAAYTVMTPRWYAGCVVDYISYKWFQ